MKKFFGSLAVCLLVVVAFVVTSIPEYWGLRTLVPSMGLHGPTLWAVFWANVWFSLAIIIATITAALFKKLAD